MEEVLPNTDEEWSSIVIQHNSVNPDFDRVGDQNEDSINRFSASYIRCLFQTGNLLCPENVKLTK